MKKYLITFLLFAISGTTIIAQNNQQNRINAEKIAFFTRNLDLSSQEAEAFWPVYNDYSNRKAKITQEINSVLRYAGQNFRNMSEEEMEEYGDRLVRLKLQEAELLVEYHKKFKEVLQVDKVMRLYNTENRFKTYLLEQLKQRRETRQTPQQRRRQF